MPGSWYTLNKWILNEYVLFTLILLPVLYILQILLKTMAHETKTKGSLTLGLHSPFAPEFQVQLKQMAKGETLASAIGFTLDLIGEEII